MKEFKVGDKIKVVKNLTEGIGKDAYIGKVFTIQSVLWMENDKGRRYGIGQTYVVYGKEIIPADLQKILITTDGKTTLARLYEGGKVIKSAEAKCGPDDTYSFDTGAKLAFERLTQPEVKRPEKEPIKLYCITTRPSTGCGLTKNGVYVFDGSMHYDGGYIGEKKDSFDSWKERNPDTAKCLIPLIKRPAKVGEYVIPTSTDGHRREVNKPYSVISVNEYSPHKNWVTVNDGRRTDTLRYDQYLVLDGYNPATKLTHADIEKKFGLSD